MNIKLLQVRKWQSCSAVSRENPQGLASDLATIVYAWLTLRVMFSDAAVFPDPLHAVCKVAVSTGLLTPQTAQASFHSDRNGLAYAGARGLRWMWRADWRFFTAGTLSM